MERSIKYKEHWLRNLMKLAFAEGGLLNSTVRSAGSRPGGLLWIRTTSSGYCTCEEMWRL